MERPVLFHDSRNTIYRVPFGAAPTLSRLTLRLDVAGCRIAGVGLRLWQENIGATLLPMELICDTEQTQTDAEQEKKFSKQRYSVTFSCLLYTSPSPRD